MKRIGLIALILTFSCDFVFSQNTYPYPSTGSVGIGTTSPNALLQVNGTGRFGTSSSSTTQLSVVGGQVGGPMFTLERPGTNDVKFSVGLSGNGFSIMDSLNSVIVMHLFGSNHTAQLYVGQYGTITPNQMSFNSQICGTTISGSYGTDISVGNFAISANLGTGAGTPGDMFFQTGSTLASGNTAQVSNTRMTIKNTTGYIGIGTTSPNAKLDVIGPVLLSGTSANLNPASVSLSYLANSAQVIMGWNRTAGAGETDFISNPATGTDGGFAFYNHDNSNNETQLMFLHANGNISVGTSDPKGYKLAVNGSLIATSVTVKTNANWPDYVFTSKYKLRKLQDVKNYIQLNHHLPDIPSQQEIKDNGLNLGDVESALTRKIEELTLYVIQKDQQLNKEKDIIDQQQSQIDALKAEMKAIELKLAGEK